MITPFYYKTTILFLDDNKNFLDSLDKYFIEMDCYTAYCMTISNFIKKYQERSINQIDQEIEADIDQIEYQTGKISVNFYKLFKYHYHVKKKDEISVVIVDYDLGYDKNGLDVIYENIDKLTYSVLLTGKANQQEIINSFNNKVISAYINKSDINLLNNLTNQINIGISTYFTSINHIPMAVLERTCPESLIFNNDFQQRFQQIFEKHSIVEYYMFENIGSFVLYDRNGNQYLLFVSYDINNKTALEEANMENASPELINLLKDPTNQLCYFNEDNITLPKVEMWTQCIQPAIIVNDQYKYSFFLQIHRKN